MRKFSGVMLIHPFNFTRSHHSHQCEGLFDCVKKNKSWALIYRVCLCASRSADVYASSSECVWVCMKSGHRWNSRIRLYCSQIWQLDTSNVLKSWKCIVYFICKTQLCGWTGASIPPWVVEATPPPPMVHMQPPPRWFMVEKSEVENLKYYYNPRELTMQWLKRFSNTDDRGRAYNSQPPRPSSRVPISFSALSHLSLSYNS